jgi:hypothetical protein
MASSSPPWPGRCLAASDAGSPHAGHGSRARQSDDDAAAAQTRPLACSTRWRASQPLHRVSTRRIPASPGLSLGPVPTGLMLVVELMLVGPTTPPPPEPCPHTPDPVQHRQPPLLTPTVLLARPNKQGQHRILISRGTTGPHRGHIRPERQGRHRSPARDQRPSSAALSSSLQSASQVVTPPRFSLARRKPEVQIPSPSPHP